MKIIKSYLLIILLAFCLPSRGQESDTKRNSLSDSVQDLKINNISDNSIILNVLNIQSQIIDNMMQMMGLLYVDINNSKARLDSLQKSLSIEYSAPLSLQKNNFTAQELLNVDTYYSIEKALQSPTSVFKLDLSKNAMTALPDEIKQFKNLQKLILSDNLLNALPDWIGQLQALQYIYLSNNQFEELPEPLSKLQSLILIDISCNPIRYVTTDIKKCPNLKVLNLHDSNINYRHLQRLERTFGDIIIK